MLWRLHVMYRELLAAMERKELGEQSLPAVVLLRTARLGGNRHRGICLRLARRDHEVRSPVGLA
jgi:hypothetical protein